MSGRHPRRRRRADPVAAADALRRFRRASGAPAPGPAGSAAAAWPSVVGDAAAVHSAPVRRTRAGVLTIACSSAAWAHELGMRREELLARLREAAPEAEVAGLRFAVADHVPGAPAQASEPAPAPPDPPRPTAADRRAGEAAGEGV
ncbi:MAG: DciA family protein, partial [Thermoleophilia bacterium]